MKPPPRVLIGLCIAAVIAAGVGVLGYLHFSAPRQRTIVLEPAQPTMDEAAARKEVERRLAAYRAKGEPILVADFKPKPLPPKDNAADAYLAAIKWLDQKPHNDDPVWQIDIDPEQLTDAQWQQLDAAVRKFAPALALIDQADGRDAADWRIDFKSPSIMILLPALNGARHSANLLHMAALTAHRDGRHDEAVRRVTQMTTLARHVDQGHPALVGHLVACGIARLATQTVREIAPTLAIAPATGPAPQGAASRQRVDALVAALLDVRTLATGWVRCTLAERMFLHDIYESLINGRVTMNDVLGDPRRKSATTTPTPPAAELLADLGPVLDYATGLIEASKHGRMPEFRSRIPQPPLTQSVVSRNLLPLYEGAAFTHYATLAELRLAAAAVALRAYAADHAGAFPASLQELVPTYLPAIPDDPLVPAPATIQFADGAVFSAGVDQRKRRAAARAGGRPASVPATQTTTRDYAIRVTK